MRGALLGIAAALALAACGPKPAEHQDAPPPAPQAGEPVDAAALDGHVVAVSETWRFEAAPDTGYALDLAGHTPATTAPYAAPRAVDGEAQFKSGGIDITLSAAPCSMDGRTYPLTARLRVQNTDAPQGCAVAVWDRDLRALLPAIDACLGQATEPMSVTYAARLADGGALVRLRQDGNPFECRVPAGGGGAPTLEGADEAPAIAGDGLAVFVRAPGDNPGGDCYQAPEVRDANGQLLGWWDDPDGC
ncbi:MAG TPA: hypothetical protein VG841_14865 [Caulobacterales bacterium]|nr:hypothetical protein [Caulobacterales bacterium]